MKTKKRAAKGRQAFTLIEMTIVLFIISLLILIIIPNISNQRKQAQKVHTTAMQSMVQAQVDAYQSQHPSDNHVTFADLSKGGYLTEKQVSQAKREGVRLADDEN